MSTVLLPSLAVLAQAAPNAPNCQDPQFLLPFVAIAAVFYFVLFRPQQKQASQHKQLLAALRKGDNVVTQAGLFGRIHSIGEKEVVLEIGGGTKVRWLKSQIAAVEKEPEAAAGEAKPGPSGETKERERS